MVSMPSLRPGGRPELLSVDFDQRPFTVAWELTRACALACLHCRAEAQPRAHPDELSTEEALATVDQIADLAPPVLVLTGGDPLMRRDLDRIVTRAVEAGLRVAVSPTTTALATRERMEHLRELGVEMIHISLDGAEAATHDAFRGFAGTFDRVTTLLGVLQEMGMPTQVGTTVTRSNVEELPQMVPLLSRSGVRIWSVFFLVPTGRGRLDHVIDAETAERTWSWLASLSGQVPFAVRTTAAPQFRRTVLRRAHEASAAPVRLTGAGYQIREAPGGVETRGVNDGKGFVFIDHRGNICPSGFLQISGGNVRTDRLADVYRSSPLFTGLRDVSKLEGRCGRCRYSDLCGGSRARAYGMTGSYYGDDPLCTLTDEEIAPPAALASA
jgi:radical SAM protein